MSETLNTAFYLPFGTREHEREAAEAAFIQDLLCYDTTWILTDQMSAVGILAGIMGADALQVALKEGAVQFIHDRQVLGWPKPKRNAYVGPVPILPIGSVPSPEKPQGFSQAPSDGLAAHALSGFELAAATVRQLARLAVESTRDFGLPDNTPSSSNLSWAEALDQDIRRYEQVLAGNKGFSITAADMIRLRRALANPKKNPMITNEIRVVRSQWKSGWALLESDAPIPPKQLAILNLFLADRFLKVQQLLGTGATLHTEPLVESFLNAEIVQIRRAVGAEVDVVLNAERVSLPTLNQSGPFPYIDLLKARESRAAQAFRKVVTARDADSSTTLLQEYLASMSRKVSDRLTVKLGRLLVGGLFGLVPGLGPIGSMLDTFAAEKLLMRGDARFFIDNTLRRITEQKSSKKSRIGR